MKAETASKGRSRHRQIRPVNWKALFWPVKDSDPWISWTSLILLAFGFMMVISTKQGTTVGNTASFFMEIVKQVIFTGTAWFVGITTLSRLFPYKLLNQQRIQYALMAIYTLLLVAVMAIGIEAGGSKAWLGIAGMTIQPSEFGKPLLIVLLASAARFAGKHKQKESFVHMFRLPLIMVLISIVFVGGAQKDFGSLIITLGIALVGFIMTSDKDLRQTQRYILIAVLIIFLILLFGVYFSDIFVRLFRDTPLLRHIATRIENMQNPYANIHAQGYQPANALYSLADAGLFGRGLGNSVRKYGFLTQAESDYILAIVVEETGIIGLGLITVCYAILLWRFVHWALRAKKPYDKVLFMCSAAYFILHFFINIGGVATLIPMTGVPLLMISAGGSALISAGIVIGICQNRIAAIVREERRTVRRRKESLEELIEEDDSTLDYRDE